MSWIAWPGAILLLIALGVAASVRIFHGTDEVRLAFTRSNLIGLAAVLFLPPAWLTLQWWRMHGRRRGRGRSPAE